MTDREAEIYYNKLMNALFGDNESENNFDEFDDEDDEECCCNHHYEKEEPPREFFRDRKEDPSRELKIKVPPLRERNELLMRKPEMNSLLYNIVDSESSTSFNVLVAGVSKESIRVEYKSGTLIVRTLNEPENTSSKVIREEFDFYNKSVMIDIPTDLYDITKITSSLKDGVLSIKVPKTKVREIKINVESER